MKKSKFYIQHTFFYVIVLTNLACQNERFLSANDIKKIDELVSPLVETNNFNGSILIAKAGKVLFSRSYGFQNRDMKIENSLNSQYYLASASMMFTSAAIMKLIDQNKLKLTDPLSRFIPKYPNGDKITIHHLLAQRTGIQSISRIENVDYGDISKKAHNASQLIEYFKNLPLNFKPGEKYYHARSDYILLAYIIEKLSGKNFGQYLQDEIFTPLGMDHSGHQDDFKSADEHMTTGYLADGLFDLVPENELKWSVKTGHASVYSTVLDLNKFATTIYQNKLLNKSSWQKIHTNYGNRVGYGWFISDHLEKKRFQMNGRSPGYSSYFSIYPDDEVTIIVLANTYISLPYDIGTSLAAIIFEKQYDLLQIKIQRLSKIESQKLIGTYQFNDKFYQPNFKMNITEKDGFLYSDWGGLIPIINSDGSINKFIQRQFWSEMEFKAITNANYDTLRFDRFLGKRIK